MTSRTHPVTFQNRKGLRLFGIVHEPRSGVESDLAVILLSPGVKSRVGPHRLYNRLGETLAECGCWVLRFDFYGLGDSDAVIGERLLADLYASVALGRYVEDTLDAMDWLATTYGVRRHILGGLCGGAITAALAAPSRQDAVGLLALGLPVQVTGSNLDQYKFMTIGQLTNLRHRYVRKLLNPKAWLRLLSFRSDFRLMFHSLLRPWRKAAPAAPVAAAGGEEPAGNANPYFAKAFLTMLAQQRPALLLFSEMDRLWWEFEEKFLLANKQALAPYQHLVEIGLVRGANHIFTLEEWQEDMLARTRVWMERHFVAASQPLVTSSVA